MKAWTIATWVGAGIGGLALGMTLANIATWPRGKARGRMPSGKRVSVLIPARNEEATIERCVRAVLENEHPIEEVIVCDDNNTDATPEILGELARQDSRLRVIKGKTLPEGWVGKPHACHQLARQARGEVLLYVDADTFLTREGIARVASLFKDLDADVVTAVPRQITGGFIERLILPLLHLTYTSWFPILLTWKSKDVRFLAANGQVLAIDRDVYDALGGFEAVRGEVVDDMAICRLVKSNGGRVVFADGFEIATCRMYRSGREVWEGFSKNIFEGLDGSPLALGVVMALYGGGFILPYVSLAMSARRPELLPAALTGIGVNTTLRTLLARRFAHAPEGILLQPLAAAGLLAIAINSARWSMRDSITWSGRTYAGKRSRAKQLPVPSSSSPDANTDAHVNASSPARTTERANP
jgi:chlorobactene glucosyltransferase